MIKSLRISRPYKDICRDCQKEFLNENWPEYFCTTCTSNKSKQLKQIAKKNRFISYKRNLTNILKKCPQIGYGHCGYYRGIFCQSTWELAVAIWAFDENLSIKRSPRIIYYMFEGKQHRYHPDFEIDRITYEIKGRVSPKELAKIEEAKRQNIPIVFVDPSACEFYFEYVYANHGLDPRVDWGKFYDKEVTLYAGNLEQIPTHKPPEKFTLSHIMNQTDPLLQKEMLFNSSWIFRDKEFY